MIVLTESYTDFNGNLRTEEFRFHFNKAELLEMELSTEGSFSERVNRIVNANSQPELLKIMKKFVVDAYGIKSEDGRRFMKSDDIRKSLIECPAYEKIFWRLATDAKAASDFINKVVPEDMPKAMPAAT
jgi:hypothetical protein